MHVIPRSREVGQSYITSVATTIYSSMFAVRLVWQQRPNLVSWHMRRFATLRAHFRPHPHQTGTACYWHVCVSLAYLLSPFASQLHRTAAAAQVLANGPGTCIPVCASAFLFRCGARSAKQHSKCPGHVDTEQTACLRPWRLKAAPPTAPEITRHCVRPAAAGCWG